MTRNKLTEALDAASYAAIIENGFARNRSDALDTASSVSSELFTKVMRRLGFRVDDSEVDGAFRSAASSLKGDDSD